MKRFAVAAALSCSLVVAWGVPALAQVDWNELNHQAQKMNDDLRKFKETATMAPRLEVAPRREEPAPRLEIAPRREAELRPLPQEDMLTTLRKEAQAERMELNRNLFNISFEGLWTLLSFQGDSPAAEWEMQEAREHARRYCELMKEIEARTGETNAYERTWAARESNLRFQALGHYAVHSTDSTVTASSHPTQVTDPTTTPKGTHTETYYAIEKVPKVAGFKNDGTPYYKMGYDVVQKQREVPNK